MDKDEATKRFPKTKMHPKKTHVTVWWCAVVCYMCGTGATGVEVLQRTGRNAPEPPTSSSDIFEHKGPDSPTRQCPAKHFKGHATEIEPASQTSPHPPYSLDLLPTDYHFFRHLDSRLRGKIFRNRGDAKNDLRKFTDSKS
ncbi:hypothetical protein RB195_008436 [Necator americanus]